MYIIYLICRGDYLRSCPNVNVTKTTRSAKDPVMEDRVTITRGCDILRDDEGIIVILIVFVIVVINSLFIKARKF